MRKTLIHTLSGVAMATTMTTGGLWSTAAHAELSGNIGVFSEYIFRGLVENDDTAVQGGLDYSQESGFYAGYWGSNLGYGDDASTGFENDFYGGFAGETASMTYDVGILQYYYISVDDADVLEVYGSVGYGPITLGANYLTDDVVWGNQGDIYWTLDYATDLPRDFSFTASLGYYTYEDSGEFITSSASDSGFRNLNLSLAHPVGSTGADMSITYVGGGEDRQENDLEDTVVLSVSYDFDI